MGDWRVGDAEGQKVVIDVQSQEGKEALEYFMLMARKGSSYRNEIEKI